MKCLMLIAVMVAAAAAAPQLLVKKEKLVLSEEPRWAERSPISAQQQHRLQHLSAEGAAQIVEQDFDMDEPGHYQFRFKTNNGIEKVEQADQAAGKVQGAYVWTSPEGAPV